MAGFDKKIVVWERANKSGKWCPYSSEVSKFLELSHRNDISNVCLGAFDEELKIFSVNLKDMLQVSETSGTKLAVRRQLYDGLSAFGRGFAWEWHDDNNGWIPYISDINDVIDTAFLEGKKSISLGKKFSGYPYEIVFSKMLQINKKSKRKHKIRRTEITSPYPIATTTDLVDVDNKNSVSPMDFETNGSAPPMEIETNHSAPPAEIPCALSPEYLAQDIPGTSDLLSQVNAYKRSVETSENVEQALNYKRLNSARNENGQNIDCSGKKQDNNLHIQQSASVPPTTVALVNGRPWTDSWPPHTPNSKLKPVPGIEPLPSYEKPKKYKRKGRGNVIPTETVNILENYTEIVELSSEISDETCIICCELLSDGSSYNDDKTIVKLTLCSHIFHKACIEAMFNSGNKEFLQCPSCKHIHGEKCGIQPPGEMIYHVIPYSLPGYPENETIRIIYNIHSGIQGPEHPHPRRRYTARGFPRHCYLPDNEIGRKILRLLIKAWKRRLIFTIGQSSTTGEDNTVTWNEIHHKTEFGCNRRGHGYPDPNYFSNVLAELEAHGVVDDEVRVWVPV